MISSFQEAFEEYSKKNFKNSYSLFDTSLETLTQDSNMLKDKFMIFINLEKYEEALVYLNQILSINPNDVEILIRKGKCYQMLNKMEQAVECFESVLSIQPSNLYALRNMVLILINMKKYEDALNYLDRIFFENSDDFEMIYFKGIILEQLGQFTDAINYYLKSLNISVSDTSVLQNISLHMVHLLGKDIAIPIFKNLLEKDPNDVLALSGMETFSNSIYDY